MPVQAAQWTEFLSCPICYNEFDSSNHQPISLGCSHTVCKTCLHKLHRKACPFDQTPISTDIDLLPVNCALLQLLGAQVPDVSPLSLSNAVEMKHYEVCRACVEQLALYLKPITGSKGVTSTSVLSRPMQRKLVTLVNCQLVEEEGRVRAVRAGRSLGERTVTELILQHQNPQQLSANLWAAVRARGCQFLGPAMQEDGLKLVLLALEDGSALSRKVLVLFVVQKLEARFPQASKTSIGHVVQLLYRASCFKVTKRDEDSSLMQLKEEFRTYEALRREHDAQIVHIAMEAGLRISPEQWSSLLYGDLVHKSHMQSIIDKLQSPESFAKSVQELTIVLQRTGDPSNLTSLRPNLDLLANIDHNPDAPPPSWEELESVMLAIKQVVHGLVEFIQNFSKKCHDAPQPQTNSKYKTSMCRDLRQQGGCPRGSNCTFAHTQDELEKFRLKNKKSGSLNRSLHIVQGVLGKALASEGSDISVAACQSSKCSADTAGVPNHSHPQLITREGDMMEEMKNAVPNGSSAAYVSSVLCTTTKASSGSMEQKSMSPSSTPVSHSSPSSPLTTAGCTEEGSAVPKHSPFLTRAQHHSQASELYYPDSEHPPFASPQVQPASGSFYPATLHGSHKTCMTRFLRSPNVRESCLPPSLESPSSSFPVNRHSPHQSGYPHPLRDQISHPTLHGQPPYGPLAPHSVYAPLYDSRRVWRPQLYHREDARSNSLPPEVLRSTVYQPPLRERFNSLDSNYYSGVEHRGVHRDYGRVPLGYEDLFRRKQEQWVHHHHLQHRHSANQPSQLSPIFTVDFGTKHVEGSGSPCMDCRFREGESFAHYSPWSCGSISPCLSSFEPDSLTHTSAHSCSEHMKMKNEIGNGGNSGAKPWLHSLDHYRRLKDEDPIIPFSEGPIISKWGAISRAARTGYHTTDPVQATACYGSASTTAINFRDYSSHLDHNDCKSGTRRPNTSGHPSFLDREQFSLADLRDQQTSAGARENLASEQHTHQTGYILDEERLCRSESEPDRDIELELRALDIEDMDAESRGVRKESVDLISPQTRGTSCLLSVSCSSPLLLSPTEEHPRPEISSLDKMDVLLQKKMAFRKSVSPGGLVPGGLSVGKLMLQTVSPHLGHTSPCTCSEMPPTELLLNAT